MVCMLPGLVKTCMALTGAGRAQPPPDLTGRRLQQPPRPAARQARAAAAIWRSTVRRTHLDPAGAPLQAERVGSGPARGRRSGRPDVLSWVRWRPGAPSLEAQSVCWRTNA